MENVYTCSCGNQTWIVLEGAVRCTVCHSDFRAQMESVKDFNHKVLEEIEETEEA
ncbi:MAG: hypothetical protein ACE14M_09795 [Terriglobales bacterium]